MNNNTMAAGNDDPLQKRFIGMFSYGSNNEQQLQARVNSPQLRWVGRTLTQMHDFSSIAVS